MPSKHVVVARRSTILAFTALTAACATNPVTGKSEISLISESQEVEMGRQGAQEVTASIGLVNDQSMQNYVHRIGTALASKSERPNLPWTFRVVDDPSPNAFALPGGFIFVTRGLLSLMNSVAELASVLGHEIGHVTAKHSVSQLSKAQLAQVGLGIGAILSPQVAALGDLAGAGLQLLFLKYGRDDERQADDLGFRYALTEGYDIREFADVFTSLQRMGQASGQSPLPSWLATHPDEGERIQRTQARIAALNRPLENLVQRTAEYMAEVDDMVYGVNPRQGFFQGTTFYHPELRFQISFPQGWKTQNLSQAVVGVSAQQDAAMQLTLGQGSPEEAARQFLSQQGIQAGQTTRENINGIPAVASYFQAQTQQGVIRGLVTFMTYGNQTYQVLAYAPAERFNQYDQLFRQSLGSFRQVTDQRVLAVQPNKIDVVRLQQPMTLAEFNGRYPSTIPIAELALINQVESPNTPIPAGTLLKQVNGGTTLGP